ncbi:alpha/beta fold hydrolase [Streptomyces sp. NBC_01275]|uniref:thioesterase II family protein n=1 Tax=Streptomyces sp. NBC_01275 TaxID=2903807 RepID=UPI00224EEC57|nr:alpha/beta fold hydrolase [Streptomyces sp. NBC_01275]MCX4766486.1 alpha/beta fold hydrolase [Streptomyces sp. NBC_01275]
MTSLAADRDLWLRRFTPAPEATARLVCFPHAGGAASAYVHLSRALAPSVEVVAVQYPGRQDRRSEPCATSIAELADRVSPFLETADADADLPLVLFGHSMGACVAFEVARRLEAGAPGARPHKLIVSGRRAPGPARGERVHLLDEQGVVAELKAVGGTVSAVLDDPDILSMALPAIRADYRAVELYAHQPGELLRCPVVAFTGDADPKAPVEEVADWAGHTTGAFRLKVFPGGHFYLSDDPDPVHEALREETGPERIRIPQRDGVS